jgi:hypothetical protein
MSWMKTESSLYIPDQGMVEIIDATNGSGCVDPRQHETDELSLSPLLDVYTDQGEVRTPGASAGDILALLKVRPDLSVLEAVLLVSTWEKTEGRLTTFHGDTHGGEAMGCGHMAKAASGEYRRYYGVEGAVAAEVMRTLLALGKLVAVPTSRAMLLGEHDESGVLVVKSKDKTVVPVTGEGKELFRYDNLRHVERLRRLANFATQMAADDRFSSIPVNTVFDYAELNAAATKQRSTTLSLIAAHLPIHLVDMTVDTPTVELLGYVEPISVR